MTQEPMEGFDQSAELLLGILALLAVEREERIAAKVLPIKTEQILARAGVSTSAIATALGKNYDAVRMAIARAESRGRRKPARSAAQESTSPKGRKP